MVARNFLAGSKTEVLDRLDHAGRIGERFVVRVDERLERSGVARHFDDFGVSVFDRFLAPLFDALFENPHAGDILQQAGSAFDASFVGDVQARSFFRDDRIFDFDTHQRPSTGAQVGEFFVFGRNGSHGRSGVVTGDGYHRQFAQSGFCGQRVGQRTDYITRHRDIAEQVGFYAHFFEQAGFELFGTRVQYLRRGRDRIFDHFFTGQHVAQRIRNEQRFFRGVQQRRVVALHRVKLVQAVEIHDLDAGDIVYLFAGQYFLEIFFRRSCRVLVAVSMRNAQYLTVFAEEYEIDAPSVDADRGDVHVFFGGGNHTGFQMFVQREDVPVSVSVQFEDLVREAGQFLHLEFAFVQRPQNGTAAGCSKVERQK